MIEPMANAHLMSLSMFWAGALMVFAPLIFAAVVLGVWWRQRGRSGGAPDSPETPRPRE